MILTDTVNIAAPIERLWTLTEDIEKWPDITPTMTSVVRLDRGPLNVGSTARVTQPRQRARVWTVTRFDPNETFAWQSRILGMPVTGTHSMVAQGDGIANTLTLEMAGPISRLLGPILASTLRRALALENAGFKQHAER
ncbi:MAG: SRPBCC family protein [Acidimicrobiales bacterium]